MSRQNTVILHGVVAEVPKIKEGEKDTFVVVHVIVSRGVRPTGDGRTTMRCDNPMIMSRNEDIIKEISTWSKGDIMHIKGVMSSKAIKKASYCEHCGERNSFYGALLFVNPIFAEKEGHCSSSEETMEYLQQHREVSNQVFAIGKLCRDPGKVRSKYDYKITEYQMMIARKYWERTDPPEIRLDWPWVKSYGTNAENDFKYLQNKAEVYVDGCLQTRNVSRRVFCGQDSDEKKHPKKDENGLPVFKKDKNGKPVGCGMQYEWKDRITEIVPYSTEYLSGRRSDEEAERRSWDKETRTEESNTTDENIAGIYVQGETASQPPTA